MNNIVRAGWDLTSVRQRINPWAGTRRANIAYHLREASYLT